MVRIAVLVTRATDYAVRILMTLANSCGGRLRTEDLAAATSVPQAYIPKVIAPLARRGWVHSFRGAGGGFSLLAQAQNITLLEILELMQGPLHMHACTGPVGCPFARRCPTHCVWLEAEAGLYRLLAQHNIAALAEAGHRQGLFA